MSTRVPVVRLVPRTTVETTARIVGFGSAAAAALRRANELDDPVFFTRSHTTSDGPCRQAPRGNESRLGGGVYGRGDTPMKPDFDLIAESVEGFGGLLRCETCGREQSMCEGDAGSYLFRGWPRCCGYTMRWWTQRQLDMGEMPKSARGRSVNDSP